MYYMFTIKECCQAPRGPLPQPAAPQVVMKFIHVHNL